MFSLILVLLMKRWPLTCSHVWLMAPAGCSDYCQKWLLRLKSRKMLPSAKPSTFCVTFRHLEKVEWMRRQGEKRWLKKKPWVLCVLQNLVPSKAVLAFFFLVYIPVSGVTALSLCQIWKPCIIKLHMQQGNDGVFQFKWFPHQNMMHADKMWCGFYKERWTSAVREEDRNTGLSPWANRSSAPSFEALRPRRRKLCLRAWKMTLEINESIFTGSC